MHEVTRSKTILEQLTEEERLHPERVDRVVKRRVAEAVKTDPATINEMLRRFQLSAMLHQWIRERIAEGKPLPKTQDELSVAIRASSKRRTMRA
jgi:signal recognition particle GTPase